MRLRYWYCPLVLDRDLVWPSQLPIVCYVAQSHVIQSHLDHHTLAQLCCYNAPNSIRLFVVVFVDCHPWKWHSISPRVALVVVSIGD